MNNAPINRHTMTVLVNNEAGVLARVVGLFSGRGYNIESLTVAEVDPASHTSRITLVTSGTPHVIEQIEAQLQRLVPVRGVINWTAAKGGIEREMALVKVAGDKRDQAKAAAEKAGARTVEATGTSFIFEVTDAPAKLDGFIEQMRGLGLVDVSRTGVAAIASGPDAK